MTSAPAGIAIPIQASPVHRNQRTFSFDARGREYKEIDPNLPTSALSCKFMMEDLLEEPTKANLLSALKVYEHAKKQAFFVPMGCSIYSGADTQALGRACKIIAEQVRSKLAEM